MTTEQYIATLERRFETLNNTGVLKDAAQATHQAQLTRIFDNGIKASGKIGAYGTQAMYASAKQFAKPAAFVPGGKTAKKQVNKTNTRPVSSTQFKNGRQRKSMYLQNGYQQLKAVQGLEASFVNLVYSSDLRNDITQSLSAQNGSITSGVTTTENLQKLQGLMNKYGHDLFALTAEEKQFFKREAALKISGCLKATA